MRIRPLIILFLAMVVLAGVWVFRPRPAPPVVKEPVPKKVTITRPPETPAEREERWLREARTAFAAAVTNDVPGQHKRTIRIEDRILGGQAVSNWTASAVVEYVGKDGNFNRITLFWKFETRADAIRIIPIRY